MILLGLLATPEEKKEENSVKLEFTSFAGFIICIYHADTTNLNTQKQIQHQKT